MSKSVTHNVIHNIKLSSFSGILNNNLIHNHEKYDHLFKQLWAILMTL